MSNWFENNPVKSIITYTIIILGAAYASMFFILDENKENLHATEVTNLKLENEQQASKIDYLKFENEKLREQNSKYYEWLSSSPNSIAFLENKLKKSKSIIDSISKYGLTKIPKDSTIVNGSKSYLFRSKYYVAGEAFVDIVTGVTLGITDVDPYNKAKGTISFPNKNPIKFTEIGVGHKWDFIYKNDSYSITLIECKFLFDEFRVEVRKN